MKKIIEKAIKFHHLTEYEIVELLKDNSINDFLFKSANEVRKKYVGDEIHLRALIEFSNICKQNCFYCGLRAENKKIKRYKLTKNEILNCVKNIVSERIKTIVLQSGEGNFFSDNELCELISEIKKNDVVVTLSIGEKSFKQYEAYKKAGATRYLLRIETTDENLYKRLHPNMNLENRKNCLKNLKKIGYEVGSGSIVGLTGQSLSSLAKDILFFKENNFDMIGTGAFISNPQTPLKNDKSGDFILSLKVMAIIRLLLPNINIPATTAMETIKSNGRIIALQSGANVVMPNFTDLNYLKYYEIYPNKANLKENLIEIFNSIGRTISDKYGYRSENGEI